MKYILFVCTENSARSQIAEALFNFHNKNPEYSGISAGTAPAGAVRQGAVDVLREKGIGISNLRPKMLSPDMVKKAARIYTMGCVEGCPITPPGKTKDWGLDDPAGKPIEKYREVRDEMERRIKKLVSEL